MEVELVESGWVSSFRSDYMMTAESLHMKLNANLPIFSEVFARARADLTEAESMWGGARARPVINCIVLFLRPPLQRISLLNMYTINCIKPLKIINIL